MTERVCKNCGGKQYEIVGQNMVRCLFCGTLYVNEYASKEEEVLTVGAYEKLRELKFDEATEEFDKIISLFPMTFEGYFGKCLAKNKIIFYRNKKGLAIKPRFFGEKIPSILEDEDYLKALDNAPEETVNTYTEKSKRIEKFCKAYQENSENNGYDVCLCAMQFDKENPDKSIFDLKNKLSEENLNTYFIQDLDGREKEDETFYALQTSKVFVLFANAKKGYFDGEFKNLFDRYFYFISQRKKSKDSFVIAFQGDVSIKDLPKEMSGCKSLFNVNADNFLNEIMLTIKKEMQKTVDVMAKIETVKLEKVSPAKKEYIDIGSITPSELGMYHVDNIELSAEQKIKWIFLTLKNGDFVTANQLIEEELQKDPNNSEIMFADLMSEYKIKTQEEFFLSVANFRNKEKIDKILKYASKDFAEYFIESWENLLMMLDSEEYYNAFLIYLASFNTSNREKFVSKVEEKAIETLDEELIEKTLKCFNPEDIERFVNFYFMLAQKSDNIEYYKKILEIDEGHEQSNFAMYFQNLVTDQDKLTYRNREEVENILKFMSENARARFVDVVLDMVLPISFYDLEESEKQIDFYLAYVVETDDLVELLKKVSLSFQEKRYFTYAEKYISIAISKNSKQAELYWKLIEIKAHCINDKELIASDVNVTKLPEWETLLATSTEEEAEKYAEIISRKNMFEGKRLPFKENYYDKKEILIKLDNFLSRNQQILLDIEKEQGAEVRKSVNYYRKQLMPFEEYSKLIKAESDYQKFYDLLDKLFERLDLLDLNLDASISVLQLYNKESGLKALKFEEQTNNSIYEKTKKHISHKKFVQKFLFGFLELFPLGFSFLLFSILIFAPKQVYLYFSQDFLMLSLIISLTISMINLIAFINIREKLSKGWSIANIIVICLGFLNLILCCLGMYINPKTIEIKNAKEFQRLLNNVNKGNFVLVEDIDMKNVLWQSIYFNGNFDGNNHKIENLKFASNSNMGLFKTNNGNIANVEIFLAEETYLNVDVLGIVATKNYGIIENCTVSGKITIFGEDSTFGGIAGEMFGGSIKNCKTNLTLNLTAINGNFSFGGLVGDLFSGKKDTVLKNNEAKTVFIVDSASSKLINFGGLVSRAYIRNEGDIRENSTHVDFSAFGSAENMVVGGLIGDGSNCSLNNFSEGIISVEELMAKSKIGGLYGVYSNNDRQKIVSHSYSTIEIISKEDAVVGSLFGYLNGFADACFSNKEYEFYGQISNNSFVGLSNCETLITEFYIDSLGFDKNIWIINENAYPILKNNI